MKIIVGSKFQLQQTILIFGTNFKKKKEHVRLKREKVKITIDFFIFELVLVPIFNLNWQFWFFGPSLSKKGNCFQSKTDKIDTIIEFCIFKLVFVSSFTLNKQFWICGPNLPMKDIYSQNQKKWTSSLNFAYSD